MPENNEMAASITKSFAEIKERTDCLIAEKKICNAAVFIDFDNVYYTLREYGVNIGIERYDLCHLLSEIYNKDILRIFNAYGDFDKIRINLTGLQSSRVQIRHVYGNGKQEQYRKNASDLELSLDALEAFYQHPEIDTFAFVTCDSDMMPIMNRLKFKGKRVILYFIGSNISQTQDFTAFADEAYDIVDLLEIVPERTSPEYWIDDAVKALKDWKALPVNHKKFLSANWAQNEISKACCITHSLALEVLKLLVRNKIMEVKTVKGKLSYEFVSDNEEPADDEND